MSTYRGGGGSSSSGGRFSRMPPSRWSGGGGRHHPYRDPQNHPNGAGPGFLVAPGRAFQDSADGSKFAKLYIGVVPRTATVEDIRPLFEEHGDVTEVIFMKDKKTGQQQSCCFVKYATLDDAERAIRALHNQYTLPGASGPIQVRYAEGERERLGMPKLCPKYTVPGASGPSQVRYADGERERLGAVEYKLYVGALHKEATEKDIEEIFSPYGIIEDICILRDDMRQCRGCGFVKLANREMALGAINALNGTYMMKGCDQPLIVRFADPKKPRPGEFRGGPSGVGPRCHAMLGPRQPNYMVKAYGHMPSNASCTVSPQSQEPSSRTSSQGYGSTLAAEEDYMMSTSTAADTACISADPTDYAQSSPTAAQLLPQQVNQLGQLQDPLSVGFLSSNQGLQSQDQQSCSMSSIQQNASDDGDKSLQKQDVPTAASQQQSEIFSISQHSPALQQSTSQPKKEVLQQPPQTLVSSQSSKQAILQNQQHLQQIRLSSPPRSAVQSASNAPCAPIPVMPSVLSKATLPSVSHPAINIACKWSEHTCPDGFKYYYNCITRESRWEKPEEFAAFEQERRQKSQKQQNLGAKWSHSPSQTRPSSSSQSPQACK